MDSERNSLIKDDFQKRAMMKNKAKLNCFGNDKKFAYSGRKNMESHIPGPIYDSSAWKFGTGKRPKLENGEKYDYYDHKYEKKFDYSTFEKQWEKISGGAISLDPRIKNDYEGSPGPGRYNQDIQVIKNKAPAYFLGQKFKKNCLDELIGTNERIGPGTYKPEDAKNPSRKFDFPKWSFGKSKRKPLNLDVWTNNETYALVSSVGGQALSRKKTEPKYRIGKSTREINEKLGMFPSMMHKEPAKY